MVETKNEVVSGATARFSAVTINENPHPNESDSWRQWREGWELVDRGLADKTEHPANVLLALRLVQRSVWRRFEDCGISAGKDVVDAIDRVLTSPGGSA